MYYVTMTDKFMSGWGMARHRANKLIFLCDTFEEARTVAENAEARDEMKYINVCGSRPSYYRSTFGTDYELNGYYVQIKDKSDYGSWYEPGYFNRRFAQ